MWDKKNLLCGILFIFFLVFFIIRLFTHEIESFYVTGALVSAIIGIAFLKRARK